MNPVDPRDGTMMVESNQCPQCGQGLGPGAVDGLCPACLARLSFGMSRTPADSTTVLFNPEDAAAAQSDHAFADTLFGPKAPPSPTSFGDYELLEELGRGGMGIVYRARQVRLNRIVAVKMIPFGPLATEASVRRFRTEAEAAAQLRHPNIIAIHEIGERDGQHYFSMDYVEGGTLADPLQEGPLSPRRAATCLRTVARAVQHAHQAGILHRDLKPSNILIDAAGEPHVADFGLARRLTGDSTLTITGQVLGSPHYMPPEQAAAGTGVAPAPAPASDIYSLGAMLYHATTGRPPFPSESVEVVLARLAVEDPVSPRLLNPRVPRDLDTICLKCLEKDPARRYASAEALADELDRFLNDEPIQAKPAGRLEKAARWCRRRPALATVLGLLIAVFLLGSAGVLWQWRRAEAAGDETWRNLYAADMALAYRAHAIEDWGRARQLLETHRPRASAGLGGGGRGAPDLRGWEWRYLWQECRGEEETTLGRHAGAVVALDYSPDGRWLASADVRGQLTLWDASARRALWSTNLSEGRINALAFSPDGRRLAHTTARRKVWLWDTRTWRLEGTLTQADVSHLAFSPDGRVLATANGMEVMVWNVENREIAKTIPATALRPHPLLVAFAPDGRTLAIGDENGRVVYWDWQAEIEQVSWRAHRVMRDSGGVLEDLVFAPAGQYLVTAGDDRTARFWTAPPRYRPFSNHTDVVRCAAFSRDGTRLITGSMDQTARLWDVETQKELGMWRVHAGCLRVRFAPDGKMFATGGSDGTVKLWSADPRVDSVRNSVRRLPAKVTDAMVFARPPRLAVTMTESSGSLWKIWNLPAFEPVQSGEHPTNFATSLKSVPAGRILEYAGRTVRWQNLVDGRRETSMTFDQGDVLSADISRDERKLAISAVNGLTVRRLPEGTELRRWATPGQGWWRHVRLAPDGTTVVTLQERDGTVTFYDLESGRTESIEGDLIGSSVMTFSSDGRWLATAGVGAGLRVYDVSGRRERLALTTGRGQVTAVAFSDDATRLACGTSSGLVALWDLATRREVAVLRGHTGMIFSLAFLDGETLASVSRDEFRLWRAPSLERIDQEAIR